MLCQGTNKAIEGLFRKNGEENGSYCFEFKVVLDYLGFGVEG